MTINRLGRKYRRLVVIARAGSQCRDATWLCRCKCGNETVVSSSNLRTGHTKSCGCLANELAAKRLFKHGHSRINKRSPEYTIWASMLGRCYNPTNNAYRHYGGRGIRVCRRWIGRNGFANFFSDMGPRPKGKSPGGRAKYSIDRLRNNGNYTPSNCAWRTQKQQMNNRRESQHG